MLERNIPPVIKDPVDFDFLLPPCAQYEMPNGLTLYVMEAGAQEVVQIEWVFEAGIWYESQKGVAQTTAALLKNGTAEKSAFSINEAIEFYGASLKVQANNDYTLITLHTLTKYLAKVLPVVLEVITQASFPEEELEIFKQNMAQRLAVNLRQCEFVANRHIDALLYGYRHPYGRFMEEEDLTVLQRQHLINFHQEYFFAGNCKIFLAGRLNSDTLSLIQHYFGEEKWGRGNDNMITHTHNMEASDRKKVFISNDPEGVQGAIRIARPLPDANHPDFLPLQVLNSLFGGYFGSRLMKNIREEKGYTYGIYAQLFRYRYGVSWLISTEAGREVVEDTISEVYKEMHKLTTELIADEELLLVKNYLLGSLLGDLDGPFALMQRWKSLILRGLDERYFYQSIQTYKTVGVEQLKQLAEQYLQPDSFYELTVI